MAKVDPSTITFSLPHNAVVRETSEATNFRVVFDCSCKLAFGLPLNYIQYPGLTIRNCF